MKIENFDGLMRYASMVYSTTICSLVNKKRNANLLGCELDKFNFTMVEWGSSCKAFGDELKGIENPFISAKFMAMIASNEQDAIAVNVASILSRHLIKLFNVDDANIKAKSLIEKVCANVCKVELAI